MTAEIVNLNKVRKARDRAMGEKDAQENRLKYGQTKSDRSLFEAKHRKSQSELDGARRQSDDDLMDDDSGPDHAS